MVKCYSPHYSGMSGTAGKSGVHMVRRGVWIMREYLIPHNPKTVHQTTVRNDFAAGVTAWHAFSAVDKNCYGYFAAGMLASGYNIYIGQYRKAEAADKAALAPTDVAFEVWAAGDPTTDIEDAIVTCYETGSSVVRYRGYTDADGEVAFALRADNSRTYDRKTEKDGYVTDWVYGQTPTELDGANVTLTAE